MNETTIVPGDAGLVFLIACMVVIAALAVWWLVSLTKKDGSLVTTPGTTQMPYTQTYSGKPLYPYCGECGAAMQVLKSSRGVFWQCSSPRGYGHEQEYIRPLTDSDTKFNRTTGEKQ